MSDVYQRIKDRLSILDVLRSVNTDANLRQRGNRWYGNCPICGKGQGGFVVYEAEGKAHCFHGGCEFHGDLFDVIKATRGGDDHDALVEAARMAGIDLEPQTKEQREHNVARAKRKADTKAILTDATLWATQRLLERPSLVEGLRRCYGFTEDTIRRWGIGYIPFSGTKHHDALARHLLDLGWTVEAIQSAAICRPRRSNPAVLRAVYANRIVFPFWDGIPYQPGNRVVYMTGRTVDSKLTPDEALWTPSWDAEVQDSATGEARPIKYKTLSLHAPDGDAWHQAIDPSLTRRPFNEGAYAYQEDTDAEDVPDVLLAVEGPTDAIALAELGLPAVGMGGASISDSLKAWLLRVVGKRQLVILGDNDGAGDRDQAGTIRPGIKGALATARAMEAMGYLGTRLVLCPDRADGGKEDAASWLRDMPGEREQRRAQVLAYVEESAMPALDRELQVLRGAPVDDDALDAFLGRVALRSELEQESWVKKLKEAFEWNSETASAVRRRLKAARKASESAKARTERQRDLALVPPEDQGPVIVVNDRDLKDIIAEAWEIFLAHNHCSDQVTPYCYQRDGRMVRLASNCAGPYIQELSEQDIYCILTDMCRWACRTWKDGECRNTPVFPPRDISRSFHARVHPDVPVLDDVVTSPVFDSTGRFLGNPGYYPDARLFYVDTGLGAVNIPINPTNEQIDEARRLIFDDLLCDFPFVANSDRANVMSAFFAGLARRMIRGTVPLHLIEAPGPGSGKNLLCDVINIVMTGQRGSPITFEQRNEEETRKKITAILRRGGIYVLIDNTEGLDSSSLAALATCTVWTDRMLGTGDSISLPNTPIWLITSNNPELSSEIARRCVRIRIDRKTEKPWDLRQVKWKHKDLRPYAEANRAQFFHAVAILVQAWIARGRVQGDTPMASFEEYSYLIGGILWQIGILDFLAKQEELYERADDAGQQWRAFVEAWAEAHGAMHVSAGELLDLADGVPTDGSSSLLTKPKHLTTLIRGEKSNARAASFGKLLNKVVGRVYSGYVIQSTTNSHIKAKVYYLERVCDIKPQSLPFGDIPVRDDCGCCGWSREVDSQTSRRGDDWNDSGKVPIAGVAGGFRRDLLPARASADAGVCDHDHDHACTHEESLARDTGYGENHPHLPQTEVTHGIHGSFFAGGPENDLPQPPATSRKQPEPTIPLTYTKISLRSPSTLEKKKKEGELEKPQGASNA